MIRHSDSAHFHVVFRRNADFRVDFQVASVLTKLGLSFRKDRLVIFGRLHSRLISGRPEFSGRNIAQINEGSPAIACGVLAPTRDRQVTPAAVSASRGNDPKVVAAVWDKSNFGPRKGRTL